MRRRKDSTSNSSADGERRRRKRKGRGEPVPFSFRTKRRGIAVVPELSYANRVFGKPRRNEADAKERNGFRRSVPDQFLSPNVPDRRSGRNLPQSSAGIGDVRSRTVMLGIRAGGETAPAGRRFVVAGVRTRSDGVRPRILESRLFLHVEKPPRKATFPQYA